MEAEVLFGIPFTKCIGKYFQIFKCQWRNNGEFSEL